jgi:hypothetical protein
MAKSRQKQPRKSKSERTFHVDVDLRNTKAWRDRLPPFWSQRVAIQRIARYGAELGFTRRERFDGRVLRNNFFTHGDVALSALFQRTRLPTMSLYKQWSFFNAKPGASLLHARRMAYSNGGVPRRRPIDYRAYEFYPMQKSIPLFASLRNYSASNTSVNFMFAGAFTDEITRKLFFVFGADCFYASSIAQCPSWVDSNPYHTDIAYGLPAISLVDTQEKNKPILSYASRAACMKAGAFAGHWGELVLDQFLSQTMPHVPQRLLAAGFFHEIAAFTVKPTLQSPVRSVSVWHLSDRAFNVEAHVDPGGDGPTWMEVLHNRGVRRIMETALEIEAAAKKDNQMQLRAEPVVNKAVSEMVGFTNATQEAGAPAEEG